MMRWIGLLLCSLHASRIRLRLRMRERASQEHLDIPSMLCGLWFPEFFAPYRALSCLRGKGSAVGFPSYFYV